MAQTNRIFRPPSEAKSLLLKVTEGCPHNNCTFCGMYRNTSFRIKSFQEIERQVHAARRNGDQVSTVFLAGGNSVILSTDKLIRILGLVYSVFPETRRVTIYGSPQYILEKSIAEIKRLRKAGLGRVHSGMESGDDKVLLKIKKGATTEEIFKANTRILQAGLELHLYMIIGIGGNDRSGQHAVGTAKLLNRINPDAIHLRTFYPLANTPLYKQWKEKSFHLLRPYKVLSELELFINELDVTSKLFSDHVSNYVYLRGKLPEDEARFLNIISEARKEHEDKLYPFFFGRKIANKC